MNLKATMGVCRKGEYPEKMVVIPQDPDMLEDNQIVLIVSAEEFIKLADNTKDLAKYIKTVQEMKEK
jgi:hypothetical protein